MIVKGDIPINAVPVFDICTHDPSTGGVSDADSAPTFSVFEETTDTPIVSAVSMTKRTGLTGDYRGTFTASLANGFEVGKWYSVIASATVAGVTAKKNCGTFRVVPAETQAGVPLGDVGYWRGAQPNALQSGRVDGYLGAAAAGVIAAATFAANALDAVWSTAARTLTAGTNIVLAKGTGVTGFNDPSASSIAAAVWDYLTSAATTVGSLGKLLVDNVNATISSRLATSAISLSGGAVTVGTNNDKTGYRLSATGVDDIWDEAQSGHTTNGTFGKYLDSSVSGVSSGGVSAATIAAAVCDELLAGHTTSGSLGKALSDVLAAVDTEIAAIKAKTDNLPSDPADASDIATVLTAIQTALSTVASYVDTEVAAIKAKTDKLTFDGSNNVAANAKAINDTPLTGNGSSGTPWGPA